MAPRDLLILSVLAEGPQHGYGIIKSVETRSESGVLLDPANLYRVLRRMREWGWVEDAPGDSPRRRIHVITESGREVLRSEFQRLRRLLDDVSPSLAGG